MLIIGFSQITDKPRPLIASNIIPSILSNAFVTLLRSGDSSNRPIRHSSIVWHLTRRTFPYGLFTPVAKHHLIVKDRSPWLTSSACLHDYYLQHDCIVSHFCTTCQSLLLSPPEPYPRHIDRSLCLRLLDSAFALIAYYHKNKLLCQTL